MALNRVQVAIVGALDLPAMDGKTSDPYVKFHYKGKEYRTPTVKKTLQPKWNYTAEFAYNNVFGPHLLYLEVWDANVIRADKLIGKATLNMEFLEVNKPVDKWYPLEHVAKAQDSAALRVKLTLLPPRSETSPNAGEGQKVVVVPHGNASATAAQRLVLPAATLQNTYHQDPPVSPPSVYPFYGASPASAAYNPSVAPSPTYCYQPVVPPPLPHPPPVPHLSPAHPPPSGYPPPPPIPSVSPPPFSGAGVPYAYPAPPTVIHSSPYTFGSPHKAGQPHKKAGKKNEEKKSSSSESESGSGDSSPEVPSRKTGKKSRSKQRVVKMEITLPSP